MSAPSPAIGIIAGGGSLPTEIAESIVARGGTVHVLAIEGETDASFASFPCTVVNWGQIGLAIKTLKDAGCSDVVIVGGVRRPDLFAMRPDLGLLQNVPRILRIIRSGGDDSVLTAVIRLFEENGFRVLGPADVAPELVIGRGLLAGEELTPADKSDIALGLEVVRALGAHDIGQGVVVAGGAVEAIEGAEGTDAMLDRVTRQRRARGELRAGPRRGVFVKRSKPGQELRVDMPAIGPQTVTRAIDAGLAGIAVESGHVLAALRQDLMSGAEAARIFIVGVDDPGAVATGRSAAGAASWTHFGRRTPNSRFIADAAKGTQVIENLAPFAASRAAVVVRDHVLGVETGESIPELLRRVSRLRQWGLRGRRWRAGALVLASGEAADSSIVAAAVDAGLAGIAHLTEVPKPDAGIVVEADRQGLIIVTRRTASAKAGEFRLFLIAGEHSGDALGGKLMAALVAKLGSRVACQGVGGARMAAEGLESEFPLAEVAVMGPLSILSRLPRIVGRVYQTVDAAVTAKPDAVVLIDSPEFTHPIARRIRRRLPQTPIIDYVSPSVWAWRPGRARRMRGYIDHVLALLPFEPEVHARLGGPPCTYVGHPLIERLPWIRALDPAPLALRLGLEAGRPVLVVLPGSRPSEVAHLTGIFGQTVQVLAGRGTTPHVVVPVVGSVRTLVEKELAAWRITPFLVESEEDKFRAFKLARAALAASGTVTLELALAGAPMVVAYRVDPLASLLRYVVKVPSVVLANLVLGEGAFPEFIQENCTAPNLAGALAPLFADSTERTRQLEALARIPDRLELPSGSPSEAAAEIVMRYVERGRLRNEL